MPTISQAFAAHLLPRASQALTKSKWPMLFHVYQKAYRCTMHGIIVPEDFKYVTLAKQYWKGKRKESFGNGIR
jgi:hypothetical protein